MKRFASLAAISLMLTVVPSTPASAGSFATADVESMVCAAPARGISVMHYPTGSSSPVERDLAFACAAVRLGQAMQNEGRCAVMWRFAMAVFLAAATYVIDSEGDELVVDNSTNNITIINDCPVYVGDGDEADGGMIDK